MKKRIFIIFVMMLFILTLFSYSSVLEKVSSLNINFVKKPTGLAYDGKNFYIADRYNALIYTVSKSGKLLSKIKAPGPWPSGLFYSKGKLFVADMFEKKIYTIDLKGNILKVIPSPLPSPMGVSVYEDGVYIASYKGRKIAKLSFSDGSILDEFEAPRGINGLFVMEDGNFFLTSRTLDKLYFGNVKRKLFYYYINLKHPYAWGVFYDNGMLYMVDQAQRKLYTYKFNPKEKWIKGEKALKILEFRNGVYNYGPSTLKKVEIYVALPENKYNQKILSIKYSHKPKILTDKTGQKYAYYVFKNVKPGKRVRFTTTFKFYHWEVKSTVIPEFIKGNIPEEVKALYLNGGERYGLEDPYIKKVIDKLISPSDDFYTKVRKIYNFIGEKITYQLYGGWEPAPVVIKRGSGSCSEYSFSTVALMRAAGIPVRYVGAISRRGDDRSYDDVFHRWNEVYFPGYGWIPVDSDAGDSKDINNRIFFFGGTKRRYLITTRHSGPSPYLGWDYNSLIKWEADGKVYVYEEKVAEWDTAK